MVNKDSEIDTPPTASRYNLRRRTNAKVTHDNNKIQAQVKSDKSSNKLKSNTTKEQTKMVPREETVDRMPLLGDDGESDSETTKLQVQSNFSNSKPPDIQNDLKNSQNSQNILSELSSSSSLIQTVTESEESPWLIAKQVFFPYMMAALGLVAAGLVLDDVQHWEVFDKVKELYVLVPSLLGLKGNLEMTLASRMSTAANNGLLDTKDQIKTMIKANMALIQCQASVVATMAALIAMLMSWIPSDTFILDHAMIMCASALYTAAIASAVLSFLMMMIIVYSHKNNINPDNVATPIAASLGDLITLALLAAISRFLFWVKDTDYYWVLPSSILLFFLACPVWVSIANANEYTKRVLHEGWEPVIAAMFISSTGGFILEKAVARFHGIAIYTPCMNGVGGNLAAIQASRISTYLHSRGKPGLYEPDYMKNESLCDCSTFTSFFKIDTKNPHQVSAFVLWILTIPGHLVVLLCYYIAAKYFESGHTTQTPLFVVVYMITAIVQVGVLLKLTLKVTHKLWKWGDDPDNSAIPYLTAFGDLIGQVLLFLAFNLLFLLGDRDEDVGE